MRRPVKKVYKKLPPHTYEPHPVATAGEASKPLIIGIIAIVAVIALSLLLLFSDQLVGKAFFTGEMNSAGAELIPTTVYENQPFSLKIKANIGSKETNLVTFTLSLPTGTSCTGITVENLLSGWSEFDRKCENGKIQFTFGSVSTGKSQTFDVAQINFPGYAPGNLQFTFDSFQAFDSNNMDQVTKEENPLVVIKAPSCGDGLVNQMSEQCDDGNTLSNDGCSSTCQKDQQLPSPGEAELIPSTVYKNQQFSLKVKANTNAQKAQQIVFKLGLPSTISCTGVTVENLLIKDGKWQENDLTKCENGVIIFNSEALADSNGNIQDKSGLIDIAIINFPGYSNDVLSFTFSEFSAYDEKNTNILNQVINPVVNLQQLQCVNPPSGLVSKWSGESNTKNDVVGSVDGIAKGGLTYAVGSSLVKVGQYSFSLDGKQSYVEIPDAPSQTPAAMTIAAWIRSGVNKAEGVIACKSDDLLVDNKLEQSWCFMLDDDFPNDPSYLKFFWWDTSQSLGATGGVSTKSTVISLGQWYHVVATYDSVAKSAKLYVNGQEVTSVDAINMGSAYNKIYDSTTPLLIGNKLNSQNNNPAQSFNGLIDDVSLWDRALTAMEIKSIYDADTAGMCKLVPQYQCKGSIPDNGVMCGNNVANADNINWQWTSACGSTQCTYTCKSGYKFEGGKCVSEQIQQQVCTANTWACEGTTAKKQCKSDGSGYNAPMNCASGETCSNGVCSSALPPPPPPPTPSTFATEQKMP